VPENVIKNIIAIASGKGGVGKSTVAVNLAIALAQTGAKVGILDADIYGPSQPAMLGAGTEKPVFKDGKFQPIERHGLSSMSIGYLIDADAPVVWRGPMIGKAMQQLLQDTRWGTLDYLVIDLPPGTGDVQLTLCQKIALDGAVVVTTPQDMALLDVRRACEMFSKMKVPILGVMENMSIYHCPECGHEASLFGSGGGKKLAEKYQVPLLGQLPLAKAIRETTDSGHPTVAAEPDSAYAKVFGSAAQNLIDTLSKTTKLKDYSSRFPKIVVEQARKDTK